MVKQVTPEKTPKNTIIISCAVNAKCLATTLVTIASKNAPNIRVLMFGMLLCIVSSCFPILFAKRSLSKKAINKMVKDAS